MSIAPREENAQHEAEEKADHDAEKDSPVLEILGLAEPQPATQPTPREKAKLLYEYCLGSNKNVSETIHNLWIVAEHYSEADPQGLENPTTINGVPTFFENLTSAEKARYCYDKITATLALEAAPVTVESLRATKRTDPNDPWSSYAGRFVRRVTTYVSFSLAVMVALWWVGAFEKVELQWIAFGCLGALVHLLNNALTTTRLQTFETSEARKIWPRLLLGGMFGFVLPWLLHSAGMISVGAGGSVAAGPIAAFFGGYSVRFAIGLLERVLSAVFPETKPGT